MLSRSEGAATRDSKAGAFKVATNADPKLHPFERAKEVRDDTGSLAMMSFE